MIANGGARAPWAWFDWSVLSFSEREQIGLALAAGMSVRSIVAPLKPSPSRICRALRRNRGSWRWLPGQRGACDVLPPP